jgi:hypothetical protein
MGVERANILRRHADCEGVLRLGHGGRCQANSGGKKDGADQHCEPPNLSGLAEHPTWRHGDGRSIVNADKGLWLARGGESGVAQVAM